MHPTDDRSAPTGLRERKKAARREALVVAGHELVLEHGLDAVTVEMICDRVGVSPRTFFNYFESKIDAILGIQGSVIDPTVAETFAAGGPSGTLLIDCAELSRAVLDASPIDLDRMGTVMELARREPSLLVRQVAHFEERSAEIEALAARRTGVDRPGAAEQTIGALVVLLVRSTLVHWDRAGRVGSPGALLPTVVAELREMFCSDHL